MPAKRSRGSRRRPRKRGAAASPADGGLPPVYEVLDRVVDLYARQRDTVRYGARRGGKTVTV